MLPVAASFSQLLFLPFVKFDPLIFRFQLLSRMMTYDMNDDS